MTVNLATMLSSTLSGQVLLTAAIALMFQDTLATVSELAITATLTTHTDAGTFQQGHP